jgi:prepilin-type N-terminal cleavage/methylation domain-containing protein
MRRINPRSLHTEGFTLVEVLISIVIAAVFIGAIAQISITQNTISSLTTSYDNADLLAYNNLRTYAYGKSPSWFQCVYSSGSPLPMTLLSSSAAVSGIPSPVTQTVTATAPYGCGGSSSGIGYPIKVQSTVTYGSSGKTVVHATYSTY